MIVKKSGILLGVYLTVYEDNHYHIYIDMQFKNGFARYGVPKRKNIKGIVNIIVEKYNLGVTDHNVYFRFDDNTKNICFLCNVWNEEDYYLEGFISQFEEEKKNLIMDIFFGLKPNAKNGNYIMFTKENMNGVEMTEDLPKRTQYLLQPMAKDNLANNLLFPYNESILHSPISICVGEDIIVEYGISFANEGYNGPQFYSGYTRLSKDFRKCGEYGDYECDLLRDEDTMKNISWDKNTIITLEGNNESKIKIMCNLKDIKYFMGIIDAESLYSTFYSNIGNVISDLMKIHYNTTEGKRVAASDIIKCIKNISYDANSELIKLYETK